MTPTLSAIANHLWQSTVFACVAGLLTLLLRKNRPRVRYAVWVAASFKFLIPFAALIAFGSHIHLRTAAVAPQSSAYVVMDDVSQPFTASAVSLPVKQVPPVRNLVPTMLVAIWAVGFIGISTSWLIRWWRIRRAVRVGSRLNLEIPIRVVSSPTVVEPGVFGTVRPVLFLPEGISERLTPDQLKAVISHELCHVRYRDNLIAAIQMFVETVFWFHPIVWWMGKRMVDERERACDEEVLRMGSDPGVYAEAILKVCQFYLESPVACVSGITGSDLKKRIQRIMMSSFGDALSALKKLILATAAALALVIPIVVGLLTAPRVLVLAQSAAVSDWQTAAGGKMAFDVASVKQNTAALLETVSSNIPLGSQDLFTPTGGLLSATNIPVMQYVVFAYKLTTAQAFSVISQAPKWANADRFDIQARASGNPTKDQFRLAMQALLADRFKLAVHFETKQLPVYALVLDKPDRLGPQLKAHSDDTPCTTAVPAPGTTAVDTVAGGFPVICRVLSPLQASAAGRLRTGARNMPMAMIATSLSNLSLQQLAIDRPILDKTGLTANYDFVIEFTPEVTPGVNFQPDPNGPTFLEAIKEQLGLRLESQTGPVDVLVIDHVEKPTDNAEAPAMPAQPKATAQAVAQSAPERSVFDVASVKPSVISRAGGEGRTRSAIEYSPDSLTMENVSVQESVQWAYRVQSYQIVGPNSLDAKRYDILAKAADTVSPSQLRLMLQQLLAERFKLRLHTETKTVPVYTLTVAKGGPKLPPQKVGEDAEGPGRAVESLPRVQNGSFVFDDTTVEEFAEKLSVLRGIDRPVVDGTGIKGVFDITLQGAASAITQPDGPSLFTLVQEQLGLKLAPATGPIDVLVIDHIEEPTPN